MLALDIAGTGGGALEAAAEIAGDGATPAPNAGDGALAGGVVGARAPSPAPTSLVLGPATARCVGDWPWNDGDGTGATCARVGSAGAPAPVDDGVADGAGSGDALVDAPAPAVDVAFGGESGLEIDVLEVACGLVPALGIVALRFGRDARGAAEPAGEGVLGACDGELQALPGDAAVLVDGAGARPPSSAASRASSLRTRTYASQPSSTPIPQNATTTRAMQGAKSSMARRNIIRPRRTAYQRGW